MLSVVRGVDELAGVRVDGRELRVESPVSDLQPSTLNHRDSSVAAVPR